MTQTIADTVRMGRGVRILENVELGEGVEIGDRVTLRNCKIGDGVRIEENCIVGYGNVTGGFTHKLEGWRDPGMIEIGDATLVRPGCTIYPGVKIGRQCWINRMVVLLERTRIGDYTSIGTMTVSEGYNSIGNHVSVHSQVQLCARLTVEDYVFIAPMNVFTNGNPMNYARDIISEGQGPLIRFGVQMAVNCTVLPRVVVGCEAVIGAGSTVSRDIPPATVAMGYPARVMNRVPPEQQMPIEIRRRYYGGNLRVGL
jgi:acetyltransferase-like isoleucine patch superfamily enzyme